ncbi:hypothetical protein BD626DRAFT_575796 [Schizophyllum amplum]|uniref:CxC2-like cysteine cluster KDZ transposase-associated domain-containing protein n=1 Tax=Schizophyllum amplum TaxID=97359 RepID=A0A550BUW8_9AGAR|nr:hypothetical protein BD626DRAFT_575796 [Auriculariopsis ampla]
MPRRARADLDVWDDFASSANYDNAPDLVYSLSSDGARLNCHAFDYIPPPAKKRKKADLDAPHRTWNPMETEGDDDFAFPESMGDGSAPHEQICDERTRKRTYGDDPMKTWRETSQQDFLEEMMWGEGLRYAQDNPRCTTCHACYSPASNPPPSSADVPRTTQATQADADTTGGHQADSDASDYDDPPLPSLDPPRPAGVSEIYCCWECGDFLQCADCCLERHRTMPLHVIQLWSGSYWEKTSLAKMGLIYQVGHGGFPCVCPDPAVRTMVVLDSILHTVHYRYCSCRGLRTLNAVRQLLRNRWYPATVTDPETCITFHALDTFRLAAVHANVNINNWLKAIEERTDALKLGKVPDRRAAFHRVVRQYTFLLRAKRFGRGNDRTGIGGTAQGGLAWRCWACPREGVNLPEGWKDVDESDAYLYRPTLAFDANFRLKNLIRANERHDPELGDGMGYFVKKDEYKAHLASYVNEVDMSTCIAFKALVEKDTKASAGLRVSGVAGAICARHELVQPHGLADLQKGERYCNMDYVLLSVVAIMGYAALTVSYDIGCQFMINFFARMKKMPGRLQWDEKDLDIIFGLPVWHGGIHEEICRTRNSLKYHDGVGRTDGEAIERIWSLLNPFAWATKYMGEGSRHDWLEDKVDNINFGKLVGIVYLLARRYIVSVDELKVQVDSFRSICKSIEPPVLRQWKQNVAAWKRDRSSPCPYTDPTIEGLSEAEVRRRLDREELEEIKAGRAGVEGTSQTAFLVAGMRLEGAQRRIIADLGGRAVLPMSIEGLINNRRRSLLDKLKPFNDLLKTYIPGASSTSSDAASDTAVDPERLPVTMPSSLPPTRVRMACAEGLPEKELQLRCAAARDTLQAIRKKQHAKQYYIEFRNKSLTGQKSNTRAHTMLATLQERIDSDAEAYRAHRRAILSLRKVDDDPEFPKLLAKDLRLEGELQDDDDDAARRLAAAGRQRSRHLHVSTSKHTMSWIWTANGVYSDATVDKDEVDKTIQHLWARALARKDRWVEEAELLREDMRRCLRSLEAEAEMWRARADVDLGRGPAYYSGTRAYALKHCALWLQMRDHFRSVWNLPIGKTKRRIFDHWQHLNDNAEVWLAESRGLPGFEEIPEGATEASEHVPSVANAATSSHS